MAPPNEIIVGPAEVYVKRNTGGISFPSVLSDRTAILADGWTLVGLAGSLNYAESGVKLRMNRTVNPIKVLGSLVPRKQIVSEFSFEAEFNVIDLSPEAMALAYGTDPADIASLNGGTGFAINTDPTPLQFAVLVRVEGQSPEVDGGNTQWQIYNAIQGGNAEGTFSKTEAFGAGHIWNAFQDSDGNFVEYVVEDGSGS